MFILRPNQVDTAVHLAISAARQTQHANCGSGMQCGQLQSGSGCFSRSALPLRQQDRQLKTQKQRQCRVQAAVNEKQEEASTSGQDNVTVGEKPNKQELQKEVDKFVRGTASTFAPRASGATGKNPAYPGSTLYTIFEVQAWVALVVGGFLSFNLILPSDEPNIARLIGMWSIWMFTIPSLRARDCKPAEKDALNILFLLVPVINVALPFVWKSFPAIFSADVVALFAIYFYKRVWQVPSQA